MISKDKLQKIKLTAEENTQLNSFIGKAVRSNYKVNVLTNRAGVSPSNGIQELYNQNTETLIIYAGILDKSIKGHTSNHDPLAEGESAYMVGEVKGTDLLHVLDLIIREKTYNRAVNENEAAIKLLQAQLDDLKTPEERKGDLLLRMAELKN